MPRALDLVAFELTLVERAAIVRTQVVDGEELAIDIAHRDIVVAHLEHRHALRRNVGHAGNALPCRHGRIVAHSASCSDGCWSLSSTERKKPSTISSSATVTSMPRDCK